MTVYKKIGVRCEGADCQRSDEMEVAAYPPDNEIQIWLASKGFTVVSVSVDGKSELRMLCAECTAKLSKVFK